MWANNGMFVFIGKSGSDVGKICHDFGKIDVVFGKICHGLAFGKIDTAFWKNGWVCGKTGLFFGKDRW